MPPCTTKRRTTTNLKTEKDPELPENRTVRKSDNQGFKEETFIQLGRRSGEGKLGQRGCVQGSGWQTKWSHICMHVNQEEQLGSETDCKPRVPAPGNKASKPQAVKTRGNLGSGRNSQPHRRVCWRDPQGPRMYTSPHTWELAPERPNLLVGSEGSD